MSTDNIELKKWERAYLLIWEIFPNYFENDVFEELLKLDNDYLYEPQSRGIRYLLLDMQFITRRFVPGVGYIYTKADWV